MVTLIISLVALALGISLRRYSKRWGTTNDRTVGKIGGTGLIIVGLLLFAIDCITIVPARGVGIVNAFGHADTTLSNGIHLVPPWASVEKIDATVQNLNLDADTHNCVTVRLANQTTACVDITLQWNIDQHANANELWQRYRGNNDDVVGNIGKNVVARELQRSLNVIFGTYNPLAVLTGAQPNSTTGELATRALLMMQASVDPGVDVDTLLIALVHFDDVTQAKLNGYAQALADTQIATQQKLTAVQQQLANAALASTASNDPGVLYQNCLNLVKALAASDQLKYLPPGFNCSGTSSPLILNPKG